VARRSQTKPDTVETSIDEDPTQPVPLVELTPTRQFRPRHLSLEPIPLTPLPALRDEPPTVDESTQHDRACTTVVYQVGAELPEDSELIPLPRRQIEDSSWRVDTREQTLRFQRWRRSLLQRRKRRRNG
jgi:hypothetical protein